jgi:PAS domain S-box-containing protein
MASGPRLLRLPGSESDLDSLLAAIARAVSERLGYGTVVINLYRPAWDDFVVTTVHGSEAARQALIGTSGGWAGWEPLLDERFERRGAYLVPHDQFDWANLDGMKHFVPDLEPREDAGAWHPEDALFAPLRGSDGELLGIASVDEPESGRSPSSEDLDVLVALAGHAAEAIESAQREERAARHRRALEQLMRVSSELVRGQSTEAILQLVCEGIAEALEFGHVVVELPDREADLYRPVAGVGIDLTRVDVQLSATIGDLDRFFDPAFEIEGCYLASREQALERVGAEPIGFTSSLNGKGPRAWSRHWLIVPLVSRTGERTGFIWTDEPRDRLLPSRERLQALRLFADQAATALESAQANDARRELIESLERRNSELEALHGTTLSLIERLDIQNVLGAIVARACALLDTPHGYIYLAEPGTDELSERVGMGIFAEHIGIRCKIGEGLSGRVWEQGKALTVDAYDSWQERLPEYEEARFSAVAGVPLQAATDVIGVLGVAYQEESRTFGEPELTLLERLGRLASLALENARLYEAAQQELEERRQAETALRKSQELHRRVVENSTELITLLDLHGRVLYTSPSTTAILGYDRDELVGRSFADLVHPDDLAAAQVVIAEALGFKVSEPQSARVCHKDGRWVVLEGIPVAVVDEAGIPEMILCVSRDVTERRRAEAERRSLEDQLRQSQKMEAVGRLAGGIAHDFNNFLTAIGGYGQLALGSLPSGEPRARRHLEELLRTANRAAALTRQLLAFSRKQVLQPRQLDLNVVVREVESMLARLIGADVELVTSLAPDLARTHADPSQLEQVVVNLALNARDAMPGGGRLLIETANAELDVEFTTRHVGSAPGSYVALTVADTGEGMDPATVGRIFEPFFTTKGPGQGTGLGLSTVYGIVKQSSGYVAVDSEPGRGTVFTVYLPRAAASAQPGPEAPRVGTAAADGRGSETVLLVEDEEIVRSLVREILEGLGYAVLEARDGEEALGLVSAASTVDLVITDLVMPKMSGRELAGRIAGVRPGTPVLFISGYTGDTMAAHGPLEPGSAFLEKPFTGRQLAERVRALLDSTASPARSRPAA